MDYKQFEGHTPESHEQRIRTAAEEYANHFENLSSYRIGLDSYIIGATAEDKRFFETVKEMETLIESLKLELQKQKELNAELVNALKWLKSRIDNYDVSIKDTSARRFEELESLIKKSSET